MKIISCLSLILNLISYNIIPDAYYYIKDKDKIIYVNESVNKKLSYSSDRQTLINISGSTVYGYLYINNEYVAQVSFPNYEQPYYRSGTQYVYLTFDQETLESNIDFVTKENVRLNSTFVSRQQFYMTSICVVLLGAIVVFKRR